MASTTKLPRHHTTSGKGMSRRNQMRIRPSRAMSSESLPGEDASPLSSSLADIPNSSQFRTNGTSSSPLTPMMIQGKKTQKSKFFSLDTLEHPSLQVGRILVLLAASIYGTNFSVVKILDDTMPLSLSATCRFGLAAVSVGAIVIGSEKKVIDSRTHKERYLALLAGGEIGLWYCIGYIAQAEGLQTVAAGKSAFFNALAVVVVPLLDLLVKRKMLRGLQVASVLVACVGVGLLELGPSGGLHISSGDVLAFMQTIFFGVGYWRLEDASHRHSEQAGRLTVGQLGAVGFGSAVYALTEYGFGDLDMVTVEDIMRWVVDPFLLGALVWTGLVSTALALYLETVALKVVSAAELTLLMTTTSLWGAAFAFVTLGEVLTPTGMVGGLLITGGCILGNMGPSSATNSVSKNSTTPLLESTSVDGVIDKVLDQV